MSDITTEQLARALTALGEQLGAIRETVHLVVIGGSGLLAIDVISRSTRALQPTADELRAGARWARTHNMPGPFDDAIARTLTELGVEDDGRDA